MPRSLIYNDIIVKLTDTRIHEYTNIRIYEYTNIRIYEYTNHEYTNTCTNT